MTSTSTSPANPSASASSSFHLRPTRLRDLPAITTLSTLAFQSDKHTVFKAHERQEEVSMPADHLASWVDEDDHDEDGSSTADEIGSSGNAAKKVDVVSAVDDTSGEVIGFVAWARFNWQGQWPEDPSAPPIYDAPTPPSPTSPPLAHLEHLTDTSMSDWQNALNTRGQRRMYILGISVHPAHQGRGVGRALIRYGTERADAAGVVAWVQSSEAAVKAFEKEGFVERKEATVTADLDEYATRPPRPTGSGDDGDGGGKWGSYTWRYMVREPRKA